MKEFDVFYYDEVTQTYNHTTIQAVSLKEAVGEWSQQDTTTKTVYSITRVL